MSKCVLAIFATAAMFAIAKGVEWRRVCEKAIALMGRRIDGE
jgi:hypothetical protein